MAQQGESGAATHLPLDHLRLGVHAFGPAVMKRQGYGGDDGLGVQVQAARIIRFGSAARAWDRAGRSQRAVARDLGIDRRCLSRRGR